MVTASATIKVVSLGNNQLISTMAFALEAIFT